MTLALSGVNTILSELCSLSFYLSTHPNWLKTSATVETDLAIAELRAAWMLKK